MLKVVKLLGKIALFSFAALGILAAFNIAHAAFGWDRALFEDRIVSETIAPDGENIAVVTNTRAMTVNTTRLSVRPASDKSDGDVVLSYKDLGAVLDIAWRDRNTLTVALPCEPPAFQRVSYDRLQGDRLRRIIIEYSWSETDCRLARGFIG